MTGDHHGQTAGTVTLLVRAVDGILGTHSIAQFRSGLIHACSNRVRAGQIDPDDVIRILTASVRDLFTGTRPSGPPRHAGHCIVNRHDGTGHRSATGLALVRI
jgi:hypothetical protein